MLPLFFALVSVIPEATVVEVEGPIVYLMDWKYDDIAKECTFLAQSGFKAVVISPATEHVVNQPHRPWHERYEVVSYKIASRSGDQAALSAMTKACHIRDVKVLVDIVLNNMASTERGLITGSGGSKANPKEYDYPDFKKKEHHFNENCEVIDFQDRNQMFDCELIKLSDLRSNNEYVRERQVKLMNDLVALGISGFLVDKTKFMWPWELAVRQTRLHDTPTEFGKHRPIMLYNVEDYGGEAVHYEDYKDLGRVTDYKYGMEVSNWFSSKANFIYVIKKDNLFPEWIPSKNALVFLTNVYTYTGEKKELLRYNENADLYKLATAFMLVFNHGLPFVLSTYKLSKPYNEAGPPSDAQGQTLSPGNECKGGWNCEHRLPEVYRMSFFHLDCKGEPVASQSGGSAGQFAFARGSRGFVAFNLEDTEWSQTFSTTLPKGDYCEVITGALKYPGASVCAKDAVKVTVDGSGSLVMNVPPKSVRAIHLWNKIGYNISPQNEPRYPPQEAKGLFSGITEWFSFSGTPVIISAAAPP